MVSIISNHRRNMRIIVLLALLVAAVAGLPQQRIIGGTKVDIRSYPYAAAILLYNYDIGSYAQECGGAIINNRSILTSNRCVLNGRAPTYWRARIGSSLANSGGIIHTVNRFITHPDYTDYNADNDVAILRTVSSISYGATVSPIAIAGRGYNVNDNTPVTIVGWGAVRYEGQRSNQLLKADLKIVNQEVCRTNYNIISMEVNSNMQCAGLPEGGADFCEGDIGNPLVHNNVLIGIASWRTPVCGRAPYPGVYTRLNRYTAWIQSNA